LESHAKFAGKHRLQFPLLVDSDGMVAKAYDCRGMIATKRTVYGINKDGTIIFAREGKPSVSEILEALKE